MSADVVTPLKRGQRVIATEPLRGVPEGTAGKVAVVNGFSWIRYWVQFDNGVDLGSIDHDKLVKAKEWDRFRRERAAAATAAAEAPEVEIDADAAGEDAGAAAAGGGGADPVVNGVAIPSHLIERSRLARERLGA